MGNTCEQIDSFFSQMVEILSQKYARKFSKQNRHYLYIKPHLSASPQLGA